MTHTNTLYTGDNLPILHGMNSESVDLIYLDPPFNSKRFYSAPIGSKAAGASFNDMWTWRDVDAAYLDKLFITYPFLAQYVNSVQNIHSKSMASYLCFMVERILEMHRILKKTGSFYLHVDPTASHYLKIICDKVFGKDNLKNEIIWTYNKWTNAAKHFQKNHDLILFYTKSNDYIFNKQYGEPAATQKIVMEKGWNINKVDIGLQLLIYNQKKVDAAVKAGKLNLSKYNRIVDKTESHGTALKDVWNIQYLHSQAKERTGYPTQKPLKLLRRIVEVSSNKGSIVFDPFCGCATTMVAAQQLERNWIGIDIEAKAADLVSERLADDTGLFTNFVRTDEIPIRTDVKLEKPSLPIKQKIFEEQEGLCNGCKEKILIKNFEIDHIIPKSKGGGDYYENYQLLCGHCNKLKNNNPMKYLMAKLNDVESARMKYDFTG